ncbi:FMN-binding protein [Actinoplanes sp. CA-131856]
MRRSTAAAVGTLTGAALIIGVRLSVQPPEAPVAAPPAVDLAGGTPTPAKPKPSATASGNKSGKATEAAKPKSGLKDGVYKGKGATNPYGTVQVSIRIEDGEITGADATYPTTADSATINPPAVAALKQETLGAKTAKDVAAVSGATYTSKSYAESLQAALDAAKA